MGAFDPMTITVRAEDWGRVPPAQRELLFAYAFEARWVNGGRAMELTLIESRWPEIEAAGKEGS